MRDWQFDEPPAGGRSGFLPLWFGLNAAVALVVGFVLGWGLRPVAAPSRPAQPRVQIHRLPPMPRVEVGPGGAPLQVQAVREDDERADEAPVRPGQPAQPRG